MSATGDTERESALVATEVEIGHSLACVDASVTALAKRERSVLGKTNPEFKQMDMS